MAIADRKLSACSAWKSPKPTLRTTFAARIYSGKPGVDMPGKAVRRRWYIDLNGIRREGSKERGFSYFEPDGFPISDERTLARIRRLRIPPAWRKVRIARGDSSPLQALGVDKKGR